MGAKFEALPALQNRHDVVSEKLMGAAVPGSVDSGAPATGRLAANLYYDSFTS